MYSRTKIRLDTVSAVSDFVSKLNSDGTTYKYILENFDCTKRVDARSYLGCIYASSDFGGEIFLINVTKDSEYPSFIYDFMI